MDPIRADEPVVEPVSVAELRGYLRLDPDDGAEDGLLAGLIAAARASLEVEARRVLVPGRYRIAMAAWPRGGRLPLPLSPLVALDRAGFAAGAGGTATDLPAGLVRLGADPVEDPALVIDPAAPEPAGRTIVIEVRAGFGGDGPPIPAPLRLAVLRLAAARYEHRGDEPDEARTDAAGLAAPFRRVRL